MENDRIVSATLADIYLQQGYIDKAIEIYAKLSKLHPENEFYKGRLVSLKREMKAKNKTPAFKRILTKKIW